MKLYISSMMSGLPNDNLERFDAVADELTILGYDVVNPAELSRMVNLDKPEPSRKDYLQTDIKALLECDGIALFGKWYMSNGAMLEYHIARELGLKIYYYDEEKGLSVIK